MNWKERLNKAKIKGEFLYVDMVDSGSYKSCPISEKFRAAYGEELIDHIYTITDDGIRLGMAFHSAVYRHNIKEAEEIYNAIQSTKCFKWKQEINWKERIELAEHYGYFDLDDAQTASDWHYCAIGEKYLNKTGKLIDLNTEDIFKKLTFLGERLGHDFYIAVSSGHLAQAKLIYDEIQETDFDLLFVGE